MADNQEIRDDGRAYTQASQILKVCKGKEYIERGWQSNPPSEEDHAEVRMQGNPSTSKGSEDPPKTTPGKAATQPAPNQSLKSPSAERSTSRRVIRRSFKGKATD